MVSSVLSTCNRQIMFRILPFKRLANVRFWNRNSLNAVYFKQFHGTTVAFPREITAKWKPFQRINFKLAHSDVQNFLRTITYLEGRTATWIDPQVGLLHRGTKKLIEYKTNSPYIDKLNDLSLLCNGQYFCPPAENFLNLRDLINRYMGKVGRASGFLNTIAMEFLRKPINWTLLGLLAVLIYRMVKSRQDEERSVEPEENERLPEMEKRDFTIAELRKFDGTQEDGRVLIAVNGNVFDVTKGKMFYGPGGPYAAFAGSDASRGLATFNVVAGGDQYDDLSDLSPMQMESVKEWETLFKEKYEFVGRLLKPGEQPNSYSEEKCESNNKKSKND